MRCSNTYVLVSVFISSIVFRFVSFVAGAFTAVLALASVLDTDLLKFELSPHGTVAFYLAVFGGIMATARGMIPEENRVFDPELLMTEVITYTHYMPEEWKSQLHSKKVFQSRFVYDGGSDSTEFRFIKTLESCLP